MLGENFFVGPQPSHRTASSRGNLCQAFKMKNGVLFSFGSKSTQKVRVV
jgi:hypothetical protein